MNINVQMLLIYPDIVGIFGLKEPYNGISIRRVGGMQPYSDFSIPAQAHRGDWRADGQCAAGALAVTMTDSLHGTLANQNTHKYVNTYVRL